MSVLPKHTRSKVDALFLDYLLFPFAIVESDLLLYYAQKIMDLEVT